MKVLVTGGAGFIASHVADAYLARGAQVWVLDDLSSGRRQNVPAGATFVESDVADPGVRDLFRDVRFDVVNHHAAQIDVRVSVNNPSKDARINLLGLLNLTEAALEVGTKRFFYVSSGGVVYGEPDVRPTPEGAPKLPLSPYGVSKLAGEFYLNYYNLIRGLEYVALGGGVGAALRCARHQDPRVGPVERRRDRALRVVPARAAAAADAARRHRLRLRGSVHDLRRDRREGVALQGRAPRAAHRA
jgi:UDP-glucose 4-epimerase